MNKDKKIAYIFSLILLIILSLSLFLSSNLLKIFIAMFLAIYTILLTQYIKKKKIVSIYKRQVLLIVLIIGLVLIMGYYLLGLKYGFYKSYFPFNGKNIFMYILPITISIICFEIVRFAFISQENKIIKILVYISSILLDVLLISTSTRFNTFNQFMDVVGLTFLPAIISNILYHSLSEKYGVYPNIAYRLITMLYVYLIPITPALPESILALVKLFIPLGILCVINLLYDKKKKVAIVINTVSNIVFAVLVCFMILTTMLLSCQFKYGALVIATTSMTGDINKGDIIVYSEYDDQDISIRQVILFKENESIIVHRVVDIIDINGEIGYVTKGDFNDDPDGGYRLKSDIVGVTEFKVPYLGYFTLWLREIFE